MKNLELEKSMLYQNNWKVTVVIGGQRAKTRVVADRIGELGEDQDMQHLSDCVVDFVLCHNNGT